ncbi:MAG: hypothetical protein RTS72_04345, partial [Candidatus Thorarchaeota archaeon]
IRERARTDSLYGNDIRIEERARVGSVYGKTIYIERDAIVEGEVLYTDSLEAEDGVTFREEPKKVDQLPSPETLSNKSRGSRDSLDFPDVPDVPDPPRPKPPKPPK